METQVHLRLSQSSRLLEMMICCPKFKVRICKQINNFIFIWNDYSFSFINLLTVRSIVLRAAIGKQLKHGDARQLRNPNVYTDISKNIFYYQLKQNQIIVIQI